MPGKLEQSFLDEVLARNDIESVVGDYVTLGKRSGSNRFGLCPFHNEKTPSFTVSPNRGTYHCFGCGKGGDAISFIRDIENLSFYDAVEFLAKRAGMEMPADVGDKENSTRKKAERMYDLNRDAAKFFREKLLSSQGGPCRQYMQERGMDWATGTRFGLGFAPNAWSELKDAMHAKGYDDHLLFDAGLIIQRDQGRSYDRFRNRLMFPIVDEKGRVVGFSGRILEKDSKAAKYMNSPDTLVYNKGKSLFAMNLAKKSKSGYIILVEGNVDVFSLHQAGFDSAVASLGTALTPEQAQIIYNYTSGYHKEVVLLYDSDEAGRKAVQRAIGILEKLDLKVRVPVLKGAKDPDEFLKKFGPDALRNALEGSQGSVEYRIERIRRNYDLDSEEDRVAFLKEAIDLLAGLPDEITRRVYSGKIADMTGTGTDFVIKETEGARKRRIKNTQKKFERDNTMPTRQVQPMEKGIRYTDPESAAAEEGIIRLLFLDEALLREEKPSPVTFSSPDLARIYTLMTEEIEGGGRISTAMLGQDLTTEQMSLLERIRQQPENAANRSETYHDYAKKIEQRSKMREKRTVDASDLAEISRQNRSTKSYVQEEL